MALTATLLTPALLSQLDAHYPKLVAGVDASTSCSLRGPSIPDLDWLKVCVNEPLPRHEVTVFADSTVAGLVVVQLVDRRIVWECINNKHPLGFAAITGEINAYCVARYGQAYGFVENPTVRAAMRSAQPAFTEDGLILRLGP